ncbi:MAG: carboxyl transferase domain-containing protein [Clostridia bacterium]
MDKKDLLKTRELKHKKNIEEALSFINKIVDCMSFVETNDYLTYTNIADEVSDAIVTGYATVRSCPVVIVAQNSTIKQGGFSKATEKKLTQAIVSACSKGIPFIFAIDSYGANVSEGVEILNSYAESLFKAAYLNTCPFITIIKGYALGNMALFATLSDVVITLDESVTAFNSPSVILSSEDKPYKPAVYFGNTTMVKNGFSTFSVKKEALAETIGKLVEYLPLNCEKLSPVCEADISVYNASVDDIEGMRGAKIIEAITDSDSYIEFSKEYATDISCGLCKIGGQTVAIAVSNKRSGLLEGKSVRKLTRFLSFSNKMSLPFVNLVDCEGIESSIAVEQSELWYDLRNLYNELDANCPRLAIIIGSAIATGYTIMASSKVFDSVLAWSTAQIAPMTASAGGFVIYGDNVKKATDVFASREESQTAYKDIDSDAYNAAVFGLVTKVINAEDTKQYLLSQLQMITVNEKR